MTRSIEGYLAVAAFLFGSATGSFANVIIHRVPRGRSIVTPRSSCPTCGEPIAWYDNIPLLSYALLGARCRRCKSRIPARYLIVEALVAAVWVALALRIGIRPELPAFLAWGTFIVIIPTIDLEHRRISRRILRPAWVFASVLLVAAAAVDSDWRLIGGIVGAVGYGLLAAVGALGSRGRRMEGVAIAGYLGLHLGWLSSLHLVSGAALAILLAGIAQLGPAGRGASRPVPVFALMALAASISILGWAGTSPG